jgi:hypothetical protein
MTPEKLTSAPLQTQFTLMKYLLDRRMQRQEQGTQKESEHPTPEEAEALQRVYDDFLNEQKPVPEPFQ